MKNIVYEGLLWLVPLGVGIYTLSYAKWLWQKKNKKGAIGVATIAALAVLYPGFVLFVLHK